MASSIKNNANDPSTPSASSVVSTPVPATAEYFGISFKLHEENASLDPAKCSVCNAGVTRANYEFLAQHMDVSHTLELCFYEKCHTAVRSRSNFFGHLKVTIQ